jgi:hypothetical protein
MPGRVSTAPIADISRKSLIFPGCGLQPSSKYFFTRVGVSVNRAVRDCFTLEPENVGAERFLPLAAPWHGK